MTNGFSRASLVLTEVKEYIDLNKHEALTQLGSSGPRKLRSSLMEQLRPKIGTLFKCS